VARVISIHESNDAWEKLWGTIETLRPATDYPAQWKVWENELLAPLLSQVPDTIRFTSYTEIKAG
jgi:hypothetical protein